MKVESNFWKNRKNIFFLFLFYLSAHFLLLLSKVVMWDGRLWTSLLKQKNYETLYWLFSQTRLLHIYGVYRVLDSLGNPVALSNVLVFASWLVAGVCVYFVLKDFARIGEKNAFFAAALFLLSPIFMVRFEIALVTYSLCNGIFFLGAYAFLRSTAATRPLPRTILQVLAAVFFIAAFFTASFLVFYGALILFAFYLFLQKKSPVAAEASKWGMGDVWIFFKKNIFWILLPFIFYLAHQKFIGAPYGMYAGYNSFIFSAPGISILKILSILVDRAYQFIAYGFFWPIIFSVSVLQNKMFLAVFLIFSACIFFLDKKLNFLSAPENGGADKTGAAPKNIFIWGVLLFIFGASAYILVGESPSPYGSRFDMRHGLILPLGCSLIILAFVDGLLQNKIWRAAKIIILAVFITFNIYNYYTLDMDWYKQAGIIEGIREKYSQGQMGKEDIFVFYDNIPMYSWRGRPIHAHEYTAYLYEATGNPKFLGGNPGGNLQFVLAARNEKLANDKSTAARVKNIIITPDSKQEPSVKNWIRLKVADLFLGEDALRSAIKSVIGVNVEISAQTPKENSWVDKLPSAQ